MSALIKRKISLELTTTVSKNRLSVFKRLGYKKESGHPESGQTFNIDPTALDNSKTTGPADLTDPTSGSNQKTVNLVNSKAPTKLDDEEPHLLEKRRQELQKELEYQLKMESGKRRDIRKFKLKNNQPSSSSDSSSSSSGSNSSSEESSSSSSTTSKESRRRINKRGLKKQRSSSSPETLQHSKKSSKKHSHVKKIRDDNVRKTLLKSTKIRLKACSPSIKKIRSTSPNSRSVHKLEMKKKILVKKEKHLQDDVRERRDRQILREKDKIREREKMRIREKERIKSRSPKSKILTRSRSPRIRSPLRSRELKKKSAERRVPSPLMPLSKYRSSNAVYRRERSDERSLTRSTTKETSRRQETPKERDRREREAARDKERAEALARCQERQRERERLAREKIKRLERDEFVDRGHKHIGRLLPHSSDRTRVIAVASRSAEKSLERERIRSRSPHSPRSRNIRTRIESYDKSERNYTHHQARSRERELQSQEQEFMGSTRNRQLDSPYGRVRHQVQDEYDDVYDEHIRGHEDRHLPPEQYSSNQVYSEEQHNRRDREWLRNDHNDELDRGFDRVNIITETNREWNRSPINHSEADIYADSKRNRPESSRQWGKNNDKRSHDWNKFGGESRQWEDAPLRNDHVASTNSVGNNAGANRKWTNTEWHGAKSHASVQAVKDDHHLEYARPIHATPISNTSSPVIQNDPLQQQQQRPIFRRTPHHLHHNQHTHHNVQQHGNAIYHPRKPHIPHPITPQASGTIRFHHPNQHLYHKRNYPNPNYTHQTPKSVPSVSGAPTSTSQAEETNLKVVAEVNTFNKQDTIASQNVAVEKNVGNISNNNITNTLNSSSISKTSDEVLNDEVIEDNLSEISEDADEILTREEENNEINNKNLKLQQTEDQNFETKPIIPSESVNLSEQNKAEELILKDQGKNNANKELKEEMDLDFEEISDGELEEEMKFKGLGDALGVDWFSLVEETRKPVVNEPIFPNSARKRWQSHRILLDIGISVKMAGKNFAEKTIKEAHRLLNAEKQEQLEKIKDIKSEKIDNLETEFEDKSEDANDLIKTESEEQDVTQQIITHPAAVIQVALREQEIARKNLILNATGSFSRALSARGDLHVRRHLCNFPTSDNFEKLDQPVNNELFETAKQLFLRKIGVNG